jgi:PHD/YefM family antitoxin component YafN of YafNO toxin-antitoxin module
MDRTIDISETYLSIGDVVKDVVARGEEIAVEQDGEIMAVVMPAELYKQWQRGRQAFFDSMRDISERVKMPEEEADQLVADAIRAVRRGEME